MDQHDADQTQPHGRTRRAKPLYYGWWIVGGSTFVQFVVATLWIQAFGAYAALIRDEYGWSKATLAGIFGVAQLLQALISPIQGWLIDRFGSRHVLRIGLLMFGFGLIGLSYTNGLMSSYFTFALISVGTALGGFATVMTAIVIWFQRKRSLALSITHAGFSVGGLCVPATIYCLETFGWRDTAFWSGVLVAVMGLIIAQIFKSDPAPHHAHQPSGAGAPPTPSTPRADATTLEALRSRTFWLISIGHAIALLVVSTLGVHLVTYLIESLDYSLAQAGYVITALTFCQLIGQFSGGALGDRFDKRWICAICMFSHGAGMVLLAYANNLLMVAGFALLQGTAWGIRGPLLVAMRADYFGSTSFGKIMGLSTLVAIMGMVIGPLFTGLVADFTGSYQVSFIILAVVICLGSACFLFLTPQHHPRTRAGQARPG